MPTSDYCIRLFPLKTPRRPVYACFALRTSVADRMMKILHLHHSDRLSIREQPESYFMPLMFCHTALGLRHRIKYGRRTLHSQQVFRQKGRLYICLTVLPDTPLYNKDIATRRLTMMSWQFTEASLQTLRRLPILGFNPRFDGFLGAIK